MADSRPEGWYMDVAPPSWDEKAQAFSFHLRKRGHKPVRCVLPIDALERAVQTTDLPVPALMQIFDAHRQIIELRAAQKLNAGLRDSNGVVLVVADDI
jgi:hypothetical protein